MRLFSLLSLVSFTIFAIVFAPPIQAQDGTEAPLANAGWLFFDDVAIQIPPGWKVLSQNSQKGLGNEIVVGRNSEYYARLFISGDKMSNNEFRTAMLEVIKNKKATADIKLGDKIIGEPAIVPYLESGLRMDLRFDKTIKGKPYYEIHSPMVAKGKGMDIYFVAPKGTYDLSTKEFEYLLAHLSPFWLPTHPGQPARPAKAKPSP